MMECKLLALEQLNTEGRWNRFAGGTPQGSKDTGSTATMNVSLRGPKIRQMERVQRVQQSERSGCGLASKGVQKKGGSEPPSWGFFCQTFR